MLRSSIGDRHEANPRYWCSKLQGDGPPGRTGPNHSNADRMTRGLSLSKGGIYNNGRLLLPNDMSSSKAMFCFTSFAFRVNLLPLK